MMYNNLSKCFEKRYNLIKICACVRFLSSTEISTALRPFYFSVHPDLFGQFPNQRNTNENSLKQLSAFIETAQSRKPISPCTLQFYLRDKEIGKFRLVKIILKERSIRSALYTILKTCELSTEYLDNLTPDPVDKQKTSYEQYREDLGLNPDIYATVINLKRKIKVELEGTTLRRWISENYKNALEKNEANVAIRLDIDKLCTDIYKSLGILEVRWDCGWNETHFRGCLQSFLSLARDHPESMGVLKGRVLVFAPFTGVSLDGHIMLNSGEVRHNWLDLIKNVQKHDIVLLRIPAFEKALSQVLRDIKVERRKFMPKILAGEYEKHLCHLMTNVSDYHGFRGYPSSWPSTLSDHEIVVETEAGPLMVSPTGQFIVPSSCPGFLLVSFITDNLHDASKRALDYKSHKHIEKSLQAQCIKEFNLLALQKDDNVTPELMIKCCERLLENRVELFFLRHLNLNIATFYSVLSDGVVCIPWNFKL